MKTKEELNKKEPLAVVELTDDALDNVVGGNRPEFTRNNLATSSENVQSAESTFSDADMAKEMTEFTKNDILMQTQQSMLAQANQSNQGVLALIG